MIALLVTLFLGGFDSEATIRALKFEEARRGALEQVLSLSKDQLSKAQQPALVRAVLGVAMNSKVSFEERVIAMRVLKLLGNARQVTALGKVLRPGNTPADIALAREAARVLQSLGANSSLAMGLTHPDPEVRQWAARVSGNTKVLCGLLRSDPWPQVRAAAALGLARHRTQSACLLKGFEDRSILVKRAVIKACTTLRLPEARSSLVAIARGAHRSTPVRADALYALGRLGATKLPEAVLKNHLRHGGMAKLAAAAVRAIGATKEAGHIMSLAIESKSGRVLMALARVVALRPNKNSSTYLRQIRTRINPRYHPYIDGLMERIKPPPVLGNSIDRDAPEDAEDF